MKIKAQGDAGMRHPSGVLLLLPVLAIGAACVPYTLGLATGQYHYTRAADDASFDAQHAWPRFAERGPREPQVSLDENAGDYAEVAEQDSPARPSWNAPAVAPSAPTSPTPNAQAGMEEIRAMIELATDQLIRADDERRSSLDCRRWLRDDADPGPRAWQEPRDFWRHRRAFDAAYHLCAGGTDSRSASEAEHKWTELLTWLEATWNAEKTQRFARDQGSALQARAWDARDEPADAQSMSRAAWERRDQAQLSELVERAEATWQAIYALKLRRRAAELRGATELPRDEGAPFLDDARPGLSG